MTDKECVYHPEGYVPDWDYMRTYIRAIEKIVIADTVKFNNLIVTSICIADSNSEMESYPLFFYLK